MKAGDKYRITKTLFEKNATNIDDKLVELVTTVDANVKKEEPKLRIKKMRNLLSNLRLKKNHR